MEVRTRDPGGSVDRIYGTIAKAASKNKFLDFRNALTLAFLEDYANLQGIGGGKHAPTSGIKLLIQDISKSFSRYICIDIKMGTLSQGMHSCIRSACSKDSDVLVKDFCYSLLYLSLDTPCIILCLPSAVIRSIIFNCQNYPFTHFAIRMITISMAVRANAIRSLNL